MSFQTNQIVATRSNLCHYLEAHCIPSSMDGHMNARLSLSFYSYIGYGFGRGVIVRVEIKLRSAILQDLSVEEIGSDFVQVRSQETSNRTLNLTPIAIQTQLGNYASIHGPFHFATSPK